MPRPNKVITALKKRDYKSTIWEMLLYEYRMAKAGSTENRLGAGALTSLLSALKEMEEQKTSDLNSEGSTAVEEIEAWLRETKN